MIEQDKLEQFYEKYCKSCGSIVCPNCWSDPGDGCREYCHEILNRKSKYEEIEEILYKNNEQKIKRERLIDLLKVFIYLPFAEAVADHLLDNGVTVLSYTDCEGNEFGSFKRSNEDAATESDRIESLYDTIKANTYICDICGKIVFPNITTSKDGKYDVMKESAEIRGGLGNKIIRNQVCNDCIEKATLSNRNETSIGE